MATLLEQAFAEISKLPQNEQDKFAKWLLDEIASERRWDRAFAESRDVLGRLADEALEEHARGETKPLELGDE